MADTNLYALILALAAAVATGLIGGFALMKRMTLAGDAMSHIALPGLGLAILWNVQPVLGAAAALALGALLIWKIEKRADLATETTIGVIFSASLAIGALITPSEDIIEALFGGAEPVSIITLAIYLLLAAAVIIFVWKERSRLIISLFNRDLATVTGVNISRLNLSYLLAFATTLVLGLRFLGALLVGALIIIPAAISRQFTHTLEKFLAGSAIASALSVAAGFWIAATFGLDTGPTIVSVAAGLFFLSLLKKKA
ncbi:MAG: metal ABC transporter permease [Patescibacteria group bacterium]|nr:metal ABC transporter permease [Patescibacteria group bacterium]MBU1034447.1 metal ABC transporter permease [Patescibacteria group bacterium]